MPRPPRATSRSAEKVAAIPTHRRAGQEVASSAREQARMLPRPRSESVPAPPVAFGRYEVRGTLGAGGFGAVYLGHDTQLDRPVAIKVLRARQLSPVQAQGEPALQEARRLAQLRHPGIVAVHDVGVQEGQVYIVSDYLDGPDLGRWLRDHRPAWPEAARIAAAVADALAHAHARLIVHRDVKPANILLGADRAPVLVDFGLALGEARRVALRRASSPARRRTCHRSKRPARPTASTAAPTSTAWAWCSTRCSPAVCRSGRPTPWSCCGRCVTTSRSPLGSLSATSRPNWNGRASRRWRSGRRIATPPPRTSPRICAGSSRSGR